MEILPKDADGSAAELCQAAMDLSWTRDPFDRLIAAHAIVANAPLVTADRRSASTCIWLCGTDDQPALRGRG